MSENVYKYLTNKYFKFLYEARFYDPKESNSKYLPKEDMEIFLGEDVFIANEIFEKDESLRRPCHESFNDWLMTIINYNQYLNYIAKCYFYHPKSDSIKLSKDLTGIIINWKDSISLEFSFEDSEIIHITLDSNTDPLKNYIENGEKGEFNDNVTFANITVTDINYDKSDTFKFMLGESNTFKFILGEEPTFKNNEEEKIIINNIKFMTSKSIYKDFTNIISNIDCIPRPDINISYHDYLEYGIYPHLKQKKRGFFK